MKKYFAVSDVHSFYSDLLEALDSKGFDKDDPAHVVILCGDAFDRGDESVKLYKWMQDLINKDRLIYVRGNHEDLIIDLVHDIQKSKNICTHHIGNGSVKTLADLMNCTRFDVLSKTFDWKIFDNNILSFVDFINTHAVDYFELGNTVFVHGWIPITSDENGHMCVHENWRDGDWNESRWLNGMNMHLMNLIPQDKTVVCGHWHTSWGWSTIRNKCQEYGDDAIFDPFIAEGIVALDACTAYTRQVNCVVFNEDGNIIKS